MNCTRKLLQVTEKLCTFFCQGCFSRIQIPALVLSVAQRPVPQTQWRGACQCTQTPECVKSMGPGSFQWCPVTAQGAQTEKQELLPNCEEKLLYSALEQAVSYSRTVWTPSFAACHRRLNYLRSRGPFQPQPSTLLWFCERGRSGKQYFLQYRQNNCVWAGSLKYKESASGLILGLSIGSSNHQPALTNTVIYTLHFWVALNIHCLCNFQSSILSWDIL